MVELPPYAVRVSDRARNVRLTVSARDGLVVVVPRRYPRGGIPMLVAARREWIERALERVAERREALLAGRDDLPAIVEMPGIRETWRVEYRPTLARGVRVTPGDGGVRLSGTVADIEACRSALVRFCRSRACAALPEALTELAAEQGLPFAAVKVRSQKTRWGSCSARGNINLNWTLVFLPMPLARHVMLHELVHTLRLDHSAKFRALLAEREPEAPARAAELRQAWRHVPSWAAAGGRGPS
jgi:predicted metal-dependent hydrolase